MSIDAARCVWAHSSTFAIPARMLAGYLAAVARADTWQAQTTMRELVRATRLTRPAITEGLAELDRLGEARQVAAQPDGADLDDARRTFALRCAVGECGPLREPADPAAQLARRRRPDAVSDQEHVNRG